MKPATLQFFPPKSRDWNSLRIAVEVLPRPADHAGTWLGATARIQPPTGDLIVATLATPEEALAVALKYWSLRRDEAKNP